MPADLEASDPRGCHDVAGPATPDVNGLLTISHIIFI
jgi:hypothetical protein